MSKTSTLPKCHDKLDLCEIRVKGHLEDRWSEWFGGMIITLEKDGETLLTGPVSDQAALHGLLKRVRDLGLTLLSVNFVSPEQAKPQEEDT